MMKGCGNLDQALQEELFRIWSLEPHFFPMFMRFVKVHGIERVDPILEKLFFFSGVHEIDRE